MSEHLQIIKSASLSYSLVYLLDEIFKQQGRKSSNPLSKIIDIRADVIKLCGKEEIKIARIYVHTEDTGDYGNVGWVMSVDIKNCMICYNSFGLYVKHHCRSCGNVVCSTCMVHNVTITELSSIGKTKVCTNCFKGCTNLVTRTVSVINNKKLGFSVGIFANSQNGSQDDNEPILTTASSEDKMILHTQTSQSQFIQELNDALNQNKKLKDKLSQLHLEQLSSSPHSEAKSHDVESQLMKERKEHAVEMEENMKVMTKLRLEVDQLKIELSRKTSELHTLNVINHELQKRLDGKADGSPSNGLKVRDEETPSSPSSTLHRIESSKASHGVTDLLHFKPSSTSSHGKGTVQDVVTNAVEHEDNASEYSEMTLEPPPSVYSDNTFYRKDGRTTSMSSWTDPQIMSGIHQKTPVKRPSSYFGQAANKGSTGSSNPTMKGQSLLKEDMLQMQLEKSLNGSQQVELLHKAIIDPNVLLGWQVLVNSSPEVPGSPALYVVTAIRKNLQRKTEFRLSCLQFEDCWVKLKRSDKKSGIAFSPQRKVLDI